MQLEAPAHPIQLRPQVGGPRISRTGNVGGVRHFKRSSEKVLAQRPVLLLEIEEPNQSCGVTAVETGVAAPDVERPGIDLTCCKIVGAGRLDLSVFLLLFSPRHQDFSLQAHGLVTPRVALI